MAAAKSGRARKKTAAERSGLGTRAERSLTKKERTREPRQAEGKKERKRENREGKRRMAGKREFLEIERGLKNGKTKRKRLGLWGLGEKQKKKKASG